MHIHFQSEITLLRADDRVGLGESNAVVSRGPLVYCLEDVDHPNLDLSEVELIPVSQYPQISNEHWNMKVIIGKTSGGRDFLFIPYFAWGNRGRSKMRVFIKAKDA